MTETTSPGKDFTLDPNNENDGDAVPPHHARRPMNAFLIFCKRHRSIVRNKYPNLENRQITKILGEWWANLDKDEKSSYTGLAKQYKDAFFDAHPDFKWYKLPAPVKRAFVTDPENTSTYAGHDRVPRSTDFVVKSTNNNHIIKPNYNIHNASTSKNISGDTSRPMFTPGKLADETQMGGLSSLIMSNDDITDEFNVHNMNIVSDNKISCSPKKRPSVELGDSDPINTLENSQDMKMQQLQDELSKTSRILELSFNSNNFDDKCSKVNSDNNEIFHRFNDLQRYEFTNHGNVSKCDDIWSKTNDVSPFKTSARTCKGKRYQEFMALGGLTANKRPRKDMEKGFGPFDNNYIDSDNNFHTYEAYNCSKDNNTNRSNLYVEHENLPIITSASMDKNNLNDTGQRANTCNENSPKKPNTMNIENRVYKASDFNLDAKIKAMPSLSLDNFLQKKRENKKRKKVITSSRPREHKTQNPSQDINSKSSDVNMYNFMNTTKISNYDPKTQSFNNNKISAKEYPKSELTLGDKIRLAEEHKSLIIGSKKRKPRKISITRLNVNTSTKYNSYIEPPKTLINGINDANSNITTKSFVLNKNSHTPEDIFGLATLAEVAAKLHS